MHEVGAFQERRVWERATVTVNGRAEVFVQCLHVKTRL